MSKRKARTNELLLQVEVRHTKALCQIVNTPRSLAVFLLIENGEYQQYVDLPPLDPGYYENPSAFADDYLVTEVLKKSPYLPLAVDKAQVALRCFIDAERSCQEVNERFSLGNETRHPSWVFDLQRNFRSILGDLGPPEITFIERSMRHGPGATTAVRGIGSVPSTKYIEGLHLTANLIPFYKAILGETWHYLQRKPAKVVQGSRFSTVPKNAKTDRSICIEPTLNMFLQLGIGKLLRTRLKRFKINLDSQERNQKLAQRAYDEHLATIDLSAASDSISWKLIQYLCTPAWKHMFELSRSWCTFIDGTSVRLEKVSSMGNGFTFELESCLFLAVVRTVVPRDKWWQISVYGDDIIVPQEFATVLIDALEYLGFSVNRSKSFLAGNFFESCGHDFFKGIPVRPYHLGGEKDGIPYEVHIANSLRLYAKMRGLFACDSRFRAEWVRLVKGVPARWRSCRVPPQLGDTGIITSRKECKAIKRNPDGFEGWQVKAISTQPVVVRRKHFGVMLAKLAAISGPAEFGFYESDGRVSLRVRAEPPRSVPSRGREPKRGFLGEVRTKWTSIQYWPSGLVWDDKVPDPSDES